MSGQVELDSHVLRRRDFPSLDDWGSGGLCMAWVQAQLRTFVERHSVDVLLDNLSDSRDAWGRPHDVVERIRELIEAGWIEVSERSPSFGAAFQASAVDEATIEILEFLPLEDLSRAEPEPQEAVEYATSPATAAQVSTLVAAAKSGIPFCEICATEPTC